MLNKVSIAIAGAIASSLLTTMPGFAQVEYSQDSFTDGVEGSVNGTNSPYELYGTGYKQDGNHLIIGISSNLPFGGESFGSARNGTVDWGDMFFNFSPDQNFEDALADGHVYGVRFAENNDSLVDTGVYKVTEVDSVAAFNSGFASLNAYLNNGGTVDPTLGNVYDLDDSSFDYLPQSANDNVIASTEGGSLGDVASLDASELNSYGFDFAPNLAQTGSETYGFKFDASKLPGGEFIAHLWAECFNEGTAFEGEVASVPEPTSAVALAVVGALAWTRKCKANNA